VAFGGLVWASDYVSLPLAGVYEPIWRYDAKTLGDDLSAHLVFGAVADGALRILWCGRRPGASVTPPGCRRPR
jgi:hypothetical protein